MGVVMKIGDEEYEWVATERFEYQTMMDRMEIKGPLEYRNKCDHCGRGDVVRATAHSLAEAIERGWLVKVTGLS